MLRQQEKFAACQTHEALLSLFLRFGNGAMLLPQLRALSLALGLYSNGQAVNRAVRELKEAGVLERQTWMDNNSDLLLARKYALRYFACKSSQEVATPPRPRTMAPYVLQARKIDWLLASIENYQLFSKMSVETFLKSRACTMFLRRPDLSAYYREHADVLAKDAPENYRNQLDRLDGLSGISVPTLEQMHRRGIYITALDSGRKIVYIASFAGRDTRADRLMDWTIETYLWAASLLPRCHMYHIVHTLDSGHREALRAALTAIAPNTSATPYWDYRLQNARLSGAVQIGTHNSNFPQNWCGGVTRTGI